jgi:predicted nucleotidyltransferase
MGTHRGHTAQILRSAMPEMQERFGVVSVRLFGSVARDEAGPDSDVDILVEFSGPVSLFLLADLREFLMEALGRSVDVGTEGSLRPRIREAVVAEAVRVA